MSNRSTCIVDGCDRPVRVKSRRLCGACYQQFRRVGTTKRQVAMKGAGWAFLAALDPATTECVLWPHSRNLQGYGQLHALGETLAHRVSCRLHNGDPDRSDLLALHRCGRGHDGCVTPSHLYWGTHTENAHDRVLHGTAIRGADNYNAQLTDETAGIAKRRLRQGAPVKEVAAELGVKLGVIYAIRSGRSWKHVPWE